MTLEALIAAVLDVSVDSILDTSGRATTDAWDSVAHLNVISAVEETYDVLFSTVEMREVTTVGAIRSFLESKGVASKAAPE
jgi:acyl carrier protein